MCDCLLGGCKGRMSWSPIWIMAETSLNHSGIQSFLLQQLVGCFACQSIPEWTWNCSPMFHLSFVEAIPDCLRWIGRFNHVHLFQRVAAVQPFELLDVLNTDTVGHRFLTKWPLKTFTIRTLIKCHLLFCRDQELGGSRWLCSCCSWIC